MRQTALDTVFNLAKEDSRVVFVGSDLGAGTLREMKEQLPNQFFMEGISEQHIVGFVAGLAKEGFIPYVNTIANFFTRRAFEQIAMDIALHGLPVRLLASGGGMVYAPLGPTHTAIDDFALMLSIPRLKVFAPCDSNEMRELLKVSVRDPSPWYIRFGKGDEANITQESQNNPSYPKIFGNPKGEIVFLTTGILIHQVLEASYLLSQQRNTSVTILHFPELSNLRGDTWADLYKNAKRVISVEEHIPEGGLFSSVLKLAWEQRWDTSKLFQKSLPHRYLHNYGSQKEHLMAHGLDALSLLELIDLNRG